MRRGEISALYTGALATTLATMISHYPWFVVHNMLDKWMPSKVDMVGLLLRSSLIGFCSSAVSDTVSNSIRVIKTVKQASTGESAPLSYREAILKVHSESGLAGIFGRGLTTRILTNGLQSMLFTVIWKLMARKARKSDDDAINDNVTVTKEKNIDESNNAGMAGKTFLRQSN